MMRYDSSSGSSGEDSSVVSDSSSSGVDGETPVSAAARNDAGSKPLRQPGTQLDSSTEDDSVEEDGSESASASSSGGSTGIEEESGSSDDDSVESSSSENESSSSGSESSSSDDGNNDAQPPPSPKQSMRAKTRKKSVSAQERASPPAATTPAKRRKQKVESVPAASGAPVVSPSAGDAPVSNGAKKKRFKRRGGGSNNNVDGSNSVNRNKKQAPKPVVEDYVTDDDDNNDDNDDDDDNDNKEEDLRNVPFPNDDETAFEVPSDSDSDQDDDRESVFERGVRDDEDDGFREIPPEAFFSPKPKTPRRRAPKNKPAMGSRAPSEHAPSQLPLDGSDGDSNGAEPVVPEAVPPTKQKKPWQRGVDFFQDVPFCGREQEVQTLQKAIERISIEWMENANEVAWITGPEGVGKTALALETFDRVFDMVYCAYGSFEENTNGAKPFFGFTECLNDLVERMHEDGGAPMWKARMEEALGGEGPFISTVIPNLMQIMEPQHSAAHHQHHNSANGGTNSHDPNSHEKRRQLLHFDSNTPKRTDRLGFAIRDFLSAISEHYPVVLVLDNLQHADLDSLYMIQSLATDKAVQNLLIIGCFGGVRASHFTSNGSTHSTSTNGPGPTFIPPTLRKVQDTIKKQGIRTTNIVLSPLSHEETEQLLSIALIEEGNDDSYDERIEDLAEILHAKCEGNPLFILHLLRVLHDRQLLVHSSQQKLWLWNSDHLEGFMDKAADTVHLLLKDKIQEMPRKMRLALTTAASAGMTSFQVDTLYHEVMAAFGGSNTKDKELKCPIESPTDLSHVLNIIASRGLIEYISHKNYRFSHDTIRHAASSLLPKGKKGKIIHYRIGTEVSALSVQVKDAEEKARLKFLAVDNLNRCALGIADGNQRAKLARLNMEAGEVAITKSAFYTAIQYFKTGISTLDVKMRWKKPLYELTLRMHLLLARSQYCCGQYAIADATIKMLLKNAMCFKDKVAAYQCMVLVHISQERYQEALDLILFVLFQLGQDIPTEDVSKYISKDIDRIRSFIREKENKDLLNPPNMTDRKSIDAMTVLAQLAEYSKYFPKTQRQYRTLATLKMMKLTLRYGYCRQTSLAYSLFASTLARYNIHKEAYRLGRMAERLATARPGCVYASQAIAHYHWNVSHWGRSYIRNLAPLLKLYNDQIDAGDFQHAPFSIMAYIHTHLASGCDLEQLEHNLNLFRGVFQDYQVGEDWQVTIPQRMTLNLMGKRGDPDVLFGKTAEEQDEILKEWEEEAQQATGGPASRRCQLFYFSRMFIACIFNDMSMAYRMEKKLTEKPDGVWIPYRSFFECLILLSRAKGCSDKKKKLKLQDKADKIIYQMTGWHNDGAMNCSVLVNFLEAEMEMLTAKERSALKMRKVWDEAIEEAKADGFLHLEAWANERAGLHFVETEVPGWASTYLTRAHRAYQRWGCHAKASLLEVQFPQYLKVGDRLNRRMSTNDWRAKYDTTRKSAMERQLDDLSAVGEDETVDESGGGLRKMFPVPKSPFGKPKKKKNASSRRISGLFAGRKSGGGAEPGSPALESSTQLDSDSDEGGTPKTPRRSFLAWGKSPKPLVETVESDDSDSDIAASKSSKRRGKLRLSGLARRSSKKKGERISQDSFNNDGLGD